MKYGNEKFAFNELKVDEVERKWNGIERRERNSREVSEVFTGY